MGRGGFEPPKALGQLIYSQSRLTTSVSARPADSTDNRPMGRHRSIMWQGLLAPSLERLVLSQMSDGLEFSGLILQAQDELAYVARYRIVVDPSWVTREVNIEVEGETSHQLTLLQTSRGEWLRDGRGMPELDGIHDSDLEWSPSTNTLPIRRLALRPGMSATVVAAWVRFPSLTVERLEQSYERVDEWRYRYRAGNFQADLQVDADGLVTSYGANWRAVAESGWS